MLEAMIVGIVVAASAGHVAWVLLPARLARALLRWPLPRPLTKTLARRAQGCGCAGCEHTAAPSAAQPRTLHWRPRPPR